MRCEECRHMLPGGDHGARAICDNPANEYGPVRFYWDDFSGYARDQPEFCELEPLPGAERIEAPVRKWDGRLPVWRGR